MSQTDSETVTEPAGSNRGRLFFRFQKRCVILESLRHKYAGIVPRESLEDVMPSLDSEIVMFGSKRKWETLCHKVRSNLREYEAKAGAAVDCEETSTDDTGSGSHTPDAAGAGPCELN